MESIQHTITKASAFGALLKLTPPQLLAHWADQSQQESTPLEQLNTMITFLKVARQRKMTVFGETALKLQPLHAEELAKLCEHPLVLDYSDMMALITSPDVSLSLHTFELIEASAPSELVAPFEFEFALTFIKKCMLTTFPDYRQKFMKPLI